MRRMCPVDQSEAEKSLSDGETEVFTSVKKISPDHKTSAFRLEFGPTAFSQ